MSPNLLGTLETELLGHRGAGHAEFCDERLILPPPQEFVINHDNTASSYIRLGTVKIGKVPTFL